MLAAMGAQLTTPLEVFARVTPEEIEELIANLTVGTGPPNLLAKSALRRFFERTDGTLVSTTPVLSPQPAALAVPLSTTGVAGPQKKLIKHSLVTNQVDEVTTEVITTNCLLYTSPSPRDS